MLVLISVRAGLPPHFVLGINVTRLAPVLRNNPLAVDLKYCETIFDLAGAEGHTDTRCSLSMSEPDARVHYVDATTENIRTRVRT